MLLCPFSPAVHWAGGGRNRANYCCPPKATAWLAGPSGTAGPGGQPARARQHRAASRGWRRGRPVQTRTRTAGRSEKPVRPTRNPGSDYAGPPLHEPSHRRASSTASSPVRRGRWPSRRDHDADSGGILFTRPVILISGRKLSQSVLIISSDSNPHHSAEHCNIS